VIGSKLHLITEAQGIPLTVILTGATRNNVTQLQALVEAIPPTRGKRGRPLSKPRVVQGDRGNAHDKYRRASRWSELLLMSRALPQDLIDLR
jgi:hypothetical protein